MDQYKVDPLNQSRSLGAASKYMASVFLWMFIALLMSSLFAFLFANNPALLNPLFNLETGGLSGLGMVVMFAPLGLVLLITFAFTRLSATALTALFMLYAAVNGISFSFILLIYTASSVSSCFFSAAAMFGVMAFLGYTTNRDLTGFGNLLLMALIGIVIASVVNFFLKSDMMGYIIAIVGVVVFTGLTAYDVQKIKRIGEGIEYGAIPAGQGEKLGIMGALTLYLDFINLFLMLLRLFGRRD